MSDTWGLWGLVEADTHEGSYPGPCGDVYCIRVAHGDPSLWQQTEEGWDHPEGFRIRPSTEREGWQLWAPAASMGGEAWAKLHAPSGSLQDQFDSLHRQLSPKPLLPWRRAAVEIPYIRNNGGVRQWAQPDDYGQKIEPWGRYMSDGQWSSGPLNPGWERGNVSFDNPMHVQHNDGNWKQELSQAHGGLTGQQLSDALLAKGHDGVITHDKYGIGEIVDLRPKDQRGHQVMHVAAAPPGYQVHLMQSGGWGDGIAGIYPENVTPTGNNWHSAISWDNAGKITNLDTKPKHQGKGLARSLYEHVRDNWRPDIMHDHAMSADGEAFANAVGGPKYFDDPDEYQRRMDHVDQIKAIRPWDAMRAEQAKQGWPAAVDNIPRRRR